MRRQGPTGRRFVPFENGRNANHHAKTAEIDGDLREDAAGKFGEEEMAEHREENAEAKDVERLLSAHDDETCPAGAQERAIGPDERDSRDGKNEKAQETQRRQVGLVERQAPERLCK